MKPKAGSHPLGKPSGRPCAVFLVGFMGAGKTSVGRRLSHRLGWDFEDLDDRIQARERRLIAEIFREFGETEFRRAEHSALRELLAELGSSPRIVALGGGAYAQTNNAALLTEYGAPVVFLDGPADELFRRCEQENSERPLQQDASQFRELYEWRRPFYLKAGWRVDTSGKDLDTIAAEVACSLGLQ
jgi:shikimate kinase